MRKVRRCSRALPLRRAPLRKLCSALGDLLTNSFVGVAHSPTGITFLGWSGRRLRGVEALRLRRALGWRGGRRLPLFSRVGCACERLYRRQVDVPHGNDGFANRASE
jgi:hypothetical protein